MRNGLLIDYEFCTGCHSCEVACKEEHGFPVGKGGIRLYQDGPWEIDGKHIHWNKVPVPTDLCDLCADRVAVELNGEIVPRAQRAQTQLKGTDTLEIVTFVQGG